MPKIQHIDENCVSKSQLRVMSKPRQKHKYYCKKEMLTVKYSQSQIDKQDRDMGRKIIVSKAKMLKEEDDYLYQNSKRRDPRWRVRVPLTKLDDQGKKVRVKGGDGKPEYRYLNYEETVKHDRQSKKTKCVSKDRLWSSTNPRHRYCERNEQREIVKRHTKAQVIKEYLAKHAKSDRKAQQTDRKVYRDVQVIDLATGKNYKFQVDKFTSINNINAVLSGDIDYKITWYDCNKKAVSVSDYDRLDPWNTDEKENKYYLTYGTQKKPPKVLVIQPKAKSNINKHFSHRRVVCVLWNDGNEYDVSVKPSQTLADLAKVWDSPDAEFKVGDRVCRRDELVWDATSKTSKVSLVVH